MNLVDKLYDLADRLTGDDSKTCTKAAERLGGDKKPVMEWEMGPKLGDDYPYKGATKEQLEAIALELGIVDPKIRRLS